MARRVEFQGEQFEKGLAIRREVLGGAYVDKSVDAATDVSAPLQKLVTEWCWGEVWSRPGLDRRTRSFLNLAMLTALNRPHEIKLHVRGALNNGVTREEIGEVVLQAAIYCGVPAALDTLRVVTETYAQLDAEAQNG
jgi:4-carboxymuconolactone decarboxylase